MTVELCEKCGVDTEEYNVKTMKMDGTVIRTVCFSCDTNERLDTYKEDRVLTSRLVMDAILARNPTDLQREIRTANELLTVRLKEFESLVWFGGLQEEVRRCKSSGMSMHAGNLTMLTFCTAGRVMITIQEDDIEFTAVADETADYSRTGTQGMRGTEADLLDLFDRAEEAWEAGIRPVADTQVSMI